MIDLVICQDEEGRTQPGCHRALLRSHALTRCVRSGAYRAPRAPGEGIYQLCGLGGWDGTTRERGARVGSPIC
jgi:hypothetical protein